MYVESLGPHNFGKVSFVKFGPANCESIGNIHRESNWVFSVSSYVLVLRFKAYYAMGAIYSKLTVVYLSNGRKSFCFTPAFQQSIQIIMTSPPTQTVTDDQSFICKQQLFS